jgi:hypothetical protein
MVGILFLSLIILLYLHVGFSTRDLESGRWCARIGLLILGIQMSSYMSYKGQRKYTIIVTKPLQLYVLAVQLQALTCNLKGPKQCRA